MRDRPTDRRPLMKQKMTLKDTISLPIKCKHLTNNSHCPRQIIVSVHTIFTNKIFPPQNKHILWKCAALKQTKLLAPDWSHFNKFKQLFQMGPIWLS